MLYCFFHLWVSCLLSLQYSVQYSYLIQSTHLSKQEGVLSILHLPSSVLESTVISGLQYFSHCSQFYCTVLCNFHMDVYDFICCHKSLEIYVDRDYCAMENKIGKCTVVLRHLLKTSCTELWKSKTNTVHKDVDVEKKWLVQWIRTLDGSKHKVVYCTGN